MKDAARRRPAGEPPAVTALMKYGGVAEVRTSPNRHMTVEVVGLVSFTVPWRSTSRRRAEDRATLIPRQTALRAIQTPNMQTGMKVVSSINQSTHVTASHAKQEVVQ